MGCTRPLVDPRSNPLSALLSDGIFQPEVHPFQRAAAIEAAFAPRCTRQSRGHRLLRHLLGPWRRGHRGGGPFKEPLRVEHLIPINRLSSFSRDVLLFDLVHFGMHMVSVEALPYMSQAILEARRF